MASKLCEKACCAFDTIFPRIWWFVDFMSDVLRNSVLRPNKLFNIYWSRLAYFYQFYVYIKIFHKCQGRRNRKCREIWRKLDHLKSVINSVVRLIPEHKFNFSAKTVLIIRGLHRLEGWHLTDTPIKTKVKKSDNFPSKRWSEKLKNTNHFCSATRGSFPYNLSNNTDFNVC